VKPGIQSSAGAISHRHPLGIVLRLAHHRDRFAGCHANWAILGVAANQRDVSPKSRVGRMIASGSGPQMGVKRPYVAAFTYSLALGDVDMMLMSAMAADQNIASSTGL
jgi:hypothetical protein